MARNLNLLSLASCSALLLAGISHVSAQEQEILLKLATPTPTTHMTEKNGTQVFMNQATERSGGKIKFEYYPAGQLGKVDQMLDLVKSGTVDIALLTGSNPVMQLLDLFSLPGYSAASCQGTAVYREFAQPGGHIDKIDYEKSGLKFLFMVFPATNEVATRGRPISSMKDFSGVKIRVGTTNLAKSVTQLGGVPLRISSAETFESFQRGTVDAIVFPLAIIETYEMDELTKFVTGNLGWSAGSNVWVINEGAWAKIPPEMQKSLEAASLDAEQSICKAYEGLTRSARTKFEEQGIKVQDFSPEVLDEINAATKPVVNEWLASMEAKGIPAGQIMADFYKALEAHK